MKIQQPLISRGFLGLAVSLFAIGRLQAQFSITGGDLYVLQDGSGTTATYQDGGGTIAAGTGSGSPIFIDQFSTGGSLLNQVSLPQTGANFLTSGDTATDGQLYYDSVNNGLDFAGFSGTAVGASLNTPTAAARDIGTVTSSGGFSIAASGTVYQNGGVIRAGITDGGGNYWASGTGSSPNQGVWYYGNNSSQAGLMTTGPARGLEIYNNNLFYTTSSGLNIIAGLPTSGTPTTTLLSSAGTTPYGFAINPITMTTAYVADENGGIWRLTYSGTFSGGVYSGGSWTQTQLDSGTKFDWLTVDWSQANPVIYATTLAGTGGNNVDRLADSGVSNPTITVLDTISASISDSGDFDGITLIQTVPEPSTYALAGMGLGLMLLFGNRHRQMGKA